MNALLIRIAADKSTGGGLWNGPVDPQSGRFVYVPIPETRPVHPGLDKPYSALAPALATFGTSLPIHLRAKGMHLDPDFEHLTYGDTRQRAKQIRATLGADDLIVFYAGLADVHTRGRLVYAIVGLFVIESIVSALAVSAAGRDINAHSRRILEPGAQDVIVRARRSVSGRLECCLPIGEWRTRAYRVRQHILEQWGGLSVKDGYLQRSARLPKFNDPLRFKSWFDSMNPILVQANN